MSFFRIKTVKGKQYLYKQTSVRDGQKVRSIMEYWGRVDGRNPPQRETNQNSDLQATVNPKRADYTMEHRKGLFKTDKAEFASHQAFDAARAKSAKESKAAWKEKNMSRAEKQERAQAKQAAEGKFKETMEAVKAFNEARAQEKEPSNSPDGS
jgi:hypothetical protein